MIAQESLVSSWHMPKRGHSPAGRRATMAALTPCSLCVHTLGLGHLRWQHAMAACRLLDNIQGVAVLFCSMEPTGKDVFCYLPYLADRSRQLRRASSASQTQLRSMASQNRAESSLQQQLSVSSASGDVSSSCNTGQPSHSSPLGQRSFSAVHSLGLDVACHDLLSQSCDTPSDSPGSTGYGMVSFLRSSSRLLYWMPVSA